MKIVFFGATQNVTGSRFLLETAQARVLIDCGLFQERELRQRNWDPFPVEPSSLDAVLLTHAHIDHCGYLPRLAAAGFQGKVYCTPPTEDIARVSLLDSARLQAADAAYKKKRHEREGRTGPYPEIPLYTEQDVQAVLARFHPVPYETELAVSADFKAVFYDAGHILGSAMIEVRVTEGGKEKTIVFSGDIGRRGRPLLRDPHLFRRADYVVTEATYGDREHDEGEDALEQLAGIINATKDAGGNLVIPTFAIGRAQELLYDLDRLGDESRIPHLMTFLDSPMGIDITGIFLKYPHYFDQETREVLKRQKVLFDIPMLKFTASQKESKAINYIKGSTIILASSGMCTGGRIKHHLIHNITRPECTVLFVGYQARGTLGREILERPDKVRIHGQSFPVRARIEKISGFSAHAGKSELLDWTGRFERVKKIFVVHSEKETAANYAAALGKSLRCDVMVPDYRDECVLI